MGFDLDTLREAVERHGRVVRVVIADLRGSSPREVGAAMLVWDGGQSGTIGGGALEFEAAQAALRIGTAPVLSQHPLGPTLGQCCGGAVTLLSEAYDAASLPEPRDGLIARAVIAGAEDLPMRVRKLCAGARAEGVAPDPRLLDGWMIEPLHRRDRVLWIWGAGHVGRALVSVLAPMPQIAITWVDTGPERFPDDIPEGVTVLPAAEPARLVSHAPRDAEHLVVTYSHALDLELCHRLLGHGFAHAGLIGSATKWARFRSRLAQLGHPPERISRIACPIGDPSLGKHPQMIAVGVAADLLRRTHPDTHRKDKRA